MVSPVIWAGLIGLAVAMYVILDGFDLGIGILFPFAREEEDRDVMMNSVAPFWDGNETWLVLGGGGLWVAFPQAYAVIMPALYLPVIGMLLGARLPRRRVRVPLGGQAARTALWDIAFAGGSSSPRSCRASCSAASAGHQRSRTAQYRRRPIRLADAVRAVSRARRGRRLRAPRRHLADHADRGPVASARAATRPHRCCSLVLAAMAIVSLWTPLSVDASPSAGSRLPNFFFLWPVPLVTAAARLFSSGAACSRRREATAVLRHRSGLSCSAISGLAISDVPYLVPPSS